MGVEPGHLRGRSTGADVEHPQTRGVVGAEEPVALHVLVVVDRGQSRGVGADRGRRRQVADIHDAALVVDAAVLLIQLVVDVGVPAVLAQPHLMAEVGVGVGVATDHRDRALVGHVQDVETGVGLTAIGSTTREEDLLARVGTRLVVVDHAVMRVLGRPGRGHHGCRRVRQRIDAKTVAAATHAIQVAGLLVDDHGVRRRRGRARIHRVHQSHHAIVDVGQVEHLDAAATLAHRIGPRLVGLDVAPHAGGPGDEAHDARRTRVGHIHEAGAVGETHQRVLTTGWTHIAPHVVAAGVGGVERGHGEPCHQADPVGREGGASLVQALLIGQPRIGHHGPLEVAFLGITLVCKGDGAERERGGQADSKRVEVVHDLSRCGLRAHTGPSPAGSSDRIMAPKCRVEKFQAGRFQKFLEAAPGIPAADEPHPHRLTCCP